MKSAFVKWEEPPPPLPRHRPETVRQYDSTLTVFDLLSSKGEWALTVWTNAGSGVSFVKWCEARELKAEHVWREGKVYVRLLLS